MINGRITGIEEGHDYIMQVRNLILGDILSHREEYDDGFDEPAAWEAAQACQDAAEACWAYFRTFGYERGSCDD